MRSSVKYMSQKLAVEGVDTGSEAAHHLKSLAGLGRTLDKGDPLIRLHHQKWAKEKPSCITEAVSQKTS